MTVSILYLATPRPCGCGSGDSGCAVCGCCRTCADEVEADNDQDPFSLMQEQHSGLFCFHEGANLGGEECRDWLREAGKGRGCEMTGRGRIWWEWQTKERVWEDMQWEGYGERGRQGRGCERRGKGKGIMEGAGKGEVWEDSKEEGMMRGTEETRNICCIFSHYSWKCTTNYKMK